MSLNTAIFPQEIQAILPVLQSLDDKQRFSLIEFLASQKTNKNLGKNKNPWVDFQQKRDEFLFNHGFDVLKAKQEDLPRANILDKE